MWQPDLHLVDRGLAEIVNLVALLEGAGAAPTLQDMHPGETPGPEVSETLDIRVKTVLDTISVSTKQWRSTGASIRHSHEVVEKRFSLAYEELNTDTRPEGFMQRPEMSQLIERLKTMDPKLAHCAVLYGLFESSAYAKYSQSETRRSVPLTFWLPLPSLLPITPPSLASESQAARYQNFLPSHRWNRGRGAGGPTA